MAEAAEAQAQAWMGAPSPAGGADALLGETFGVSGQEFQQFASSGEAQARAFTQALEYIERHQLPVSRAQAAGWTLLRMLDQTGGAGYAQIAEEAERLRLLGGPASDFVAGLQAIALSARPRLMTMGGGGGRRGGGLFGGGRR